MTKTAHLTFTITNDHIFWFVLTLIILVSLIRYLYKRGKRKLLESADDIAYSIRNVNSGNDGLINVIETDILPTCRMTKGIVHTVLYIVFDSLITRLKIQKLKDEDLENGGY